MYAGEWFKGQCHGYGIHMCEDGCIYYRELKGGIKHGIGHYRFRSLYVCNFHFKSFSSLFFK
ncbi:hypothetical protein Hanom_Chr14g01334071 [Helianthus anomalus]